MISVIIPLYNVEKYIGTCIESILGQSYGVFEILLINNCSTDYSLQICQSYADKDSRIRIFSCEKNEGPGRAREIGFSLARGKWICYVDSDDYLEPDAFEKISDCLKSDADIYVFGFKMCYEDKKGVLLYEEEVVPRRQSVSKQADMGKLVMRMEQQRVIPYMWNKIYKAEFLRDHHVDFIKITLMEDYFYNMQAFSHAVHVEVYEYAFYHYRRPMQATLATVYRNDFFDLSKQRYHTYEQFLLSKKEEDQEYWQMAYVSYIKHLLSCLSRDAGSCLDRKQKKKNAKKYLQDDLTAEIVKKYQANSWKMRVIRWILKEKKVFWALLLGKSVYLFQNKFKVFYQKIKHM